MGTFAELSLSARIRAAMFVIVSEPSLTVEQRSELVALAVWPSNAVLPGPVTPPRRRSTDTERAAAVRFFE